MSKFRRGKDIPKAEKRVPISGRVRASLKANLVREAKASGHSLAELMEAILEDYGAFLDKTSKGRT